MTFKPISDSVILNTDSTVKLYLKISPQKEMEFICSIHKTEDVWHVKAQMVCTCTMSNHTQPTQKYECSLGSVDLNPLETKTIGAWKAVFCRSSGEQWNVPPLLSTDHHGPQIDPIECLAKYANQNLLEITAYENGVAFKSDYLTLKE